MDKIKLVIDRFISFDSSQDANERLRRFVERKELKIGSLDYMSYKCEPLWDSTLSRSVSRQTHGFIFLSCVFGQLHTLGTEEQKILSDRLIHLISYWKNLDKSHHDMAFHDETTAQRVINLSGLVYYFKGISDEIIDTCMQIIQSDIELLKSENFYAGLNNHGMFQDISILTAINILNFAPEAESLEQLALSRLEKYFSSCFTTEGIHTENTPSYHLMVSKYLKYILEYTKNGGSGISRKLQDLLDSAEIYAAHCLTPSGYFPPMSDTDHKKVLSGQALNTYRQGYLQYSISHGAQGKEPSSLHYIAPLSGYAMLRSDWSEDATYFNFACAYNADYHKHPDENNIYLQHDGHEIIREAGPFGYDRQNKFTKFGFSSRAHNTLLVDGIGLPRTDQKSNQSFLENISDENIFRVRGKTTRFRDVDWSRCISIDDYDFKNNIRIEDTITSLHEHTYTLIWHLGAGLKPFLTGNVIEVLSSENQKLAELIFEGSPISEIRLLNGQERPYVQGWEFPEMGKRQRSYTVELDIVGSKAILNTEIRLNNFLLDQHTSAEHNIWSTYFGEKPVNYHFEDSKTFNPKGLIVIFSAILPKWSFTYNYRNTLSDSSDYHKLYILDSFGDQGSYYIGNGRNLAELRSVQGLIAETKNKFNISNQKVICVGSSKGGSAAIIHGLISGAHEIVVGAPQYRIGSFLKTPHPNILEYITGGTADSDVAWLDNFIPKLLSSYPPIPKFTILVGREDHHYKNHIIPLVDRLNQLGFSNDFFLLPSAPHSDIGKVFTQYLNTRFTPSSELPDPIYAYYDNNSKKIFSSLFHADPKYFYAFRLFKDGSLISSTKYGHSSSHSWDISESGSYRVRIYKREFMQQDPVARTSITVKVKI
ncbi:heparinase II/III family protein [Rothia sp. LK2588]|uniref:heparinase II/III domain-containing protein n=1 Tax=Rothia sp. LK2588 TaxID=3114369 RepID=UPI0034CF8AF8